MDAKQPDVSDVTDEERAKYHLKEANLTESSMKTLTQLFSMQGNAKVYHNYYNVVELANVLLSTKYIKSCNVIPDIVNIICEFHGIVGWSEFDKSDNIKIMNSDDNNIKYAILESDKTNDSLLYDRILLNEWINIDCGKKIFRYLFKVNRLYRPKNGDPYPLFQIGFLTRKFKRILYTSVDDDSCVCSSKYSIGCKCDGDEIWHRFGSSAKGKTKVSWRYFENEMIGSKSCMLIELNLIDKEFKVYCEATALNDDYSFTQPIRKSLIDIIEQADLESVILSLEIMIRRPGFFSIGLVKFN